MARAGFQPAYLRMSPEELGKRLAGLREMMRECRLCPRNCRVDRLAGELGVCGVGCEPMVSSYGPHFGEEAPLVGRHGSGTIFLTGCNLKCIFCQNYDISHLRRGEEVSTSDVARMMLRLQAPLARAGGREPSSCAEGAREACHNINWVTPTHQAPMLVEALASAMEQGLSVPVVYNCGGYESLDAIRLLDGVVDIYMPDAKYGDNDAGRQLSGVPDYWDRNREALAEMHRQVGDLQIDESGIATRGLLVRHLVLPENLARTDVVMQFLASLSKHTYVNVMAQYRPEYRAGEVPELTRRITGQEYRAGVQAALDAGLTRLDDRWGAR